MAEVSSGNSSGRESIPMRRRVWTGAAAENEDFSGNFLRIVKDLQNPEESRLIPVDFCPRSCDSLIEFSGYYFI
jgi:hypothetical protein